MAVIILLLLLGLLCVPLFYIAEVLLFVFGFMLGGLIEGIKHVFGLNKNKDNKAVDNKTV